MESENPSWKSALRKIARKLNKERILYTVVGGASIALHGLSIQVRDIDIETNRSDAYRFQELYQSHTLEPVDLKASEIYRSYYGKFLIDGTPVEILGDLHRREGYEWIPTSCLNQAIIEINGVPIVCSWLEEETLAYIRRGRLDRAGECLKLCDHDRLMSLISGKVRTNVILLCATTM